MVALWIRPDILLLLSISRAHAWVIGGGHCSFWDFGSFGAAADHGLE